MLSQVIHNWLVDHAKSRDLEFVDATNAMHIHGSIDGDRTIVYAVFKSWKLPVLRFQYHDNYVAVVGMEGKIYYSDPNFFEILLYILENEADGQRAFEEFTAKAFQACHPISIRRNV